MPSTPLLFLLCAAVCAAEILLPPADLVKCGSPCLRFDECSSECPCLWVGPGTTDFACWIVPLPPAFFPVPEAAPQQQQPAAATPAEVVPAYNDTPAYNATPGDVPLTPAEIPYPPAVTDVEFWSTLSVVWVSFAAVLAAAVQAATLLV